MATVSLRVSLVKNDKLIALTNEGFAVNFFETLGKEIGRNATKFIRDNAEKFFKKSKGRLKASWYYKYWWDREQKVLKVGIYNKKPYAKILNTTGVEPHFMYYLLYPKVNVPGKVRVSRKGWVYNLIPVPVNGQVLIRGISERTFIRRPGWFHRGIKPMHFLEDGMSKYYQLFIRNDIEKVIDVFMRK